MNIDKLIQIPKASRNELQEVIEEYQINTALRLSHFLSQCHHESGGFRSKIENMNYGAKRLMEVFPKYFPTLQMAQEYAGKPEKIGSRVYANRMGNGDESTGEGFKYRGRGFIQITGKNKYRTLSNLWDIDILDNPDLIAEKYPFKSAGWFWNAAKLNQYADKGSTMADVEKVTKIVNGGKNGLQSRRKLFVNYYQLLKG